MGDRDQGQERNLILLPPEVPSDAPSIIWVWEAIMVVFCVLGGLINPNLVSLEIF